MATTAKPANAGATTTPRPARKPKSAPPVPVELDDEIDEERSSGWPNWAWPAIVGVIAGIAWALVDFNQSIVLGSETYVLEYEYANAWWAAILAGLAGFCAAWAILPKHEDEEE